MRIKCEIADNNKLVDNMSYYSSVYMRHIGPRFVSKVMILLEANISYIAYIVIFFPRGMLQVYRPDLQGRIVPEGRAYILRIIPSGRDM